MKRKVQLYVAGRQVDLGDDSFILYNWTREELGNPTAVVNSSSHQIQLPGTCRNNSVLGAAFRLDRRTLFGNRYDGTQFDPTRKTPFMLYDNDGTVLESGYCRLDEVNTHNRRHAYTMTLYGGLGSFFYALASKEDGTPRTLADLTWADMDGADVTDFDVTPAAVTVQDAWTYLGGGEPERRSWWNVLNFAPCYNGLPDDFDATHALMKAGGLDTYGYTNIPEGKDEDGEHGYEYAYKAGLDCALVSFTNPHTEWELGDLRWYLQRPVVSVKAFIAAICDTRNNGGYEVNLDETFFKDDNPAYADAWWTLPMIATEDRNNVECLKNVLAATKSPMSYLVDYAKHFGLVFMWDTARHEVSIVTRATFYQQEFGGGNPEEGTETVVPSSHITKGTGSPSNYYSIQNPTNGYTNTESTSHCSINLTRGASGETHFYYGFDFSSIPANAVINSVTVKTKTYLSNTKSANIASRGQNVCKGTTPNGTNTTISTTATVRTLDAGTGWTRQDLDTLAIHVYATRPAEASTLTTNYTLRFYGAEVTVEYEVPAPHQFIPVIDLTKRIDRGQPITIDPVLADRKWYQLGDGGKGEFAEQYKADYGRGYAIQRIDTGYEFDAGTTVLTEGQTFQEAAEVSETDFLFAAAVNNNLRGARFAFTLPRYERVSIELWNAEGESQSYDITCPEDVNYYDNPDHPFTDWLPKLQLHGADNKGNDGTDTLVFFSGVLDTPSYGSGGYAIRRPYFLTDDNDAMTDLAGGPCWDLTRTSGIQRASLPSFRRNVLSGPYIVQSWEWGAPAARPVPDIQYPNGAPTALYDMWWKAYLADRYNVDTAVLKCMADLRGLPVGQELLRRFYWYDNALWTLNAIRNHPLTSWDLTECEFVRVHDKTAYTDGPGSLSTHFLDITPYSTSFQVKSRGEILTLTVRSSSAWTLTMSDTVAWLVPSTDTGTAGTSVLELTALGNDSNARRSVSVTLTNNDGISKLFTVIQPPKTAGDISLSPASLNINSAGTGLRGASSRVSTTDNAAWDIDTSTVESWLRYQKSSAGITVYCDGNSTASPRSSYIKVYLTDDPTVYAILAVTQEEGASGKGGITLLDGNGNSSATVQATGGSLTLYVTIPEGADWDIAASENWVSVSPVSGAGNGTLAVTIPSYSGSSDRQATITATRDGYSEGAIFYIIQAAPAVAEDEIRLTRADAPLYNNDTIESSAGTYPFDVKSNGAWTVVASSSWIHPQTQYGAWSGSGNATLWYSVDVNTGSNRTGTIVGTCGNVTSTFYVYQAGGGVSPSLAASFNKSYIDSTAQTLYLTIVCNTSWSIDQVSTGLTPASYSGTGNATIEVSVAANGGSSQRTLSLRVKTSNLSTSPSVKQNPQATTDYIRVTPFGTINMIAADTRQEFELDCSTSWQATTSASGVTITPSSGSGSGIVVVTFAANQSTDPVTIPLIFATTNGSNKTASATIVQAGAASQQISVSPTSLSLPAGSSSGSVAVTATGAWTASKSDSWISLSTSSGSAGSGLAITVSASANNNTSPRSGRVTFTCGNATATLWVNQAGIASVDSIDAIPASVTLAAANGSTGSTTVYASGSWKIASSTPVPSWLAVSGSTSGNPLGETMSFSARSANNSAVPRTANLRLELVSDSSVYKMVSVSQEGQVILYASPSSVSVFAYQGAGVTDITCNTTWEVLSHSEDIVIEDGTESGSGNGQISWYAKGNPTSSARTLTITVETTDHTRTATVTITQAAGILQVSTGELTLAGNGDTAMVYVQSSDPWTIDSNTVPAWLSISPMGGSQAFNELAFTAGANPYNFERSQTVTVQNAYGKKAYITVTQTGKSSESLSISPETVQLNSNAATSGTLSIVCSTDWYIEQNDELLFSQEYGSGTRSVTWTLGENSDEDYREVVVTVRTMDGSIVKRCTIWQPGTTNASITFFPDTDSMTFNYGAPSVAKTAKLRVIAKQAWTASGDGNWIGADKSSGAAGTVVEVTFTPTISSSDVQIGHWTVTTSGGSRTLIITTLPI